MDEHHHVRVLLDGAGFTDVGEHGAVVGAARGRAGELGKGDDRHAQLRGQPLERAGNGRDFFLAAAEAPGGGHELYVVDHNEVQPLLQLQAPRLGAHLGHGDAGGGVHEHAAGTDGDHRLGELAPLLIRDLPAAHALHVHLGLGAEHAHGQLFGGHFQGEHRRLLARANGGVFDDVHAKAGFAHGGAGGDEHQLARVQAGEHIVQFRIAGGHALDAAVVFDQFLDLLEGIEQHGLDGLKLLAALAHGDIVDGALGRLKDIARLLLAIVTQVDNALGGADELAQRRLFIDDAYVGAHVGGGRHGARQADEILRPAHRLKLAAAVEFGVQRHQIDGAPRLGKRAHGGIDLAVGGVVKIILRERFEDQQRRLVGAQHRPQHRALGLGMVGHCARFPRELFHITCFPPSR